MSAYSSRAVQFSAIFDAEIFITLVLFTEDQLKRIYSKLYISLSKQVKVYIPTATSKK